MKVILLVKTQISVLFLFSIIKCSYFPFIFASLDMSSAAFIEALPVIEFVGQLLGKDVISRPLSDSDRVKVLSLLSLAMWGASVQIFFI